MTAAKINDRMNARYDNFDKSRLPEGITVGYIGDVTSWSDNRAWGLFRKNATTGRSEMYGRYPTHERYKLLAMMEAIIWASEAKAPHQAA